MLIEADDNVTLATLATLATLTNALQHIVQPTIQIAFIGKSGFGNVRPRSPHHDPFMKFVFVHLLRSISIQQRHQMTRMFVVKRHQYGAAEQQAEFSKINDIVSVLVVRPKQQINLLFKSGAAVTVFFLFSPARSCFLARTTGGGAAGGGAGGAGGGVVFRLGGWTSIVAVVSTIDLSLKTNPHASVQSTDAAFNVVAGAVGRSGQVFPRNQHHLEPKQLKVFSSVYADHQ